MKTKNSPYTNIFGALFIIVALVLFIAPYFIDLKKTVEDVYLYIIGGVGLLLILGVSDEVVKIILSFVKTKLRIKDGTNIKK